MEKDSEAPKAPPSKAEEKAWGAVATPKFLVDFMLSLVKPIERTLKILEPACGSFPFLESFAKIYGTHHEFVGVDIRPEAIAEAKQKVHYRITTNAPQ